MARRVALLSTCLLLAVICVPMSGFAQEAHENEAPQASAPPAVIEIRALLVEWTTDPPRAGRETKNELAGDRQQVAERVARLRQENKLVVLERLRLMTLDGSKAMMNSGESVPVTQGVTMGSFGMTRNAVNRTVGTYLEVTPQFVAPETIQMALGFERSRLVARADVPIWVAPNQQEKVAATEESFLTMLTTFRMGIGETEAITCQSSDGRHRVLLISASLVP